ncbi:MAG: hypothetical protein KBS75_09205 [Bacteroidales bacterium]|nr:hypothetical protein [Candidatus Equimonas faecalis]
MNEELRTNENPELRHLNLFERAEIRAAVIGEIYADLKRNIEDAGMHYTQIDAPVIGEDGQPECNEDGTAKIEKKWGYVYKPTSRDLYEAEIYQEVRNKLREMI